MIKASNLSKSFSIYKKPYEFIFDIFPFLGMPIAKHIALQDISFEIRSGEFVGIIGKNGSGKSTLLKVLCGVLKQNSGTFEINGRTLSLLELGTGFDPELSGRENIIQSVYIMGFERREVVDRLGEIEAFADIGEYFDMPMKTYSSGMYVRLAMSLFLHLEPELFIIDEALSVGDIFFQQKCFARIEEMRCKGVTFLFVSHDLGLVQKVCDRVMFLEEGRLVYFGDRHEACRLYYGGGRQNTSAQSHAFCQETVSKQDMSSGTYTDILESCATRVSSPLARILSARVRDESCRDTLSVEMMGALWFDVSIWLDESLEHTGFSLLIKNQTGLLISCINNYIIERGELELSLRVDFCIEAGEYTFDMLIGESDSAEANQGRNLCGFYGLGPLSVLFDYRSKKAPFYGLTYINNLLEVRKV